MWRRIIMNTVRMILCGNVEDSRMNPSEKVFMRNASIRKKVLALAGYEFIVFLLFLWIFIVCIIFTEFDYESIIAIVQWELKWILYFTISIILQFAMYYFFWKKSKILKIVTLLFSLIIVIVPLHVFDFT